MDGNTSILLGLALALAAGAALRILLGRIESIRSAGRAIALGAVATAACASVALMGSGASANRQSAREDIRALCAEPGPKSDRSTRACASVSEENRS